MAAILAPEGEVKGALAGWPGVSIAAVNSRESVVISGEEAGVAAVCDRLSAQGITCKPVRVAQGAHSRLVEPMLDDLEKAARKARCAIRRSSWFRTSRRYPSVRGSWTLVLEAPRPVAGPFSRRGFEGSTGGVSCLPGNRPSHNAHRLRREGIDRSGDVCGVASLRPGSDDWREMLDGLGVLYTHGVPVDWPELDRGYDHRKIDLPT